MDQKNATSKTFKAARDFTRRSLLKGAALGG